MVNLTFVCRCVLTSALLSSAGRQVVHYDTPMKNFRDDKHKYTYRFPAYLEVEPAAKAAELLKRTPCVKAPLRASRKTPRGHDTLEIIEVEFGCLNRHADANVMDSVVMSNVGGSLKAYGGAASIGTPQRYKLSGLEAEYLSASVAASSIRTGMVLHSGSVCALMDQTVICWLVQSEDLNRLRGLLANPVEFDGRAGVALVPEELLQ